MPGLNCHFVSRFLTTPWEYGQRRLWYFDFDEGRVCNRSSESLFAETDANTPAVEARLNALIETPIAAAIQRLVADPPEQPQQQLEWPLFRALALLAMLQPLRPPGNADRTEGLEATVMRTDAELDEIAQAANESYHIGRITVRADAALLYPAAGFFPLVALDNDDNYRAAVAIPISTRHVFVAAPRTIDWDSATAQWAANGAGMLSNLSVGTGARVVLPPSCMEAFNTDQIIQMVTEMRTVSRELTELCGARNEALARLNEALSGSGG